MGFYFERSLIRPLVRIRRERRLPFPGQLAIRTGQMVTAIQVVARAEEPVDFLVVNAVDRLGISAAELTRHLVVEPGQPIERGRVLWHKRSFWRRGRQLKSPLDGLFLGVTDDYLILQPLANLIELRAMMPGLVVAMVPGLSVTLESDGALVQALWSVGQDTYGKLKVVSPTADSLLTAETVTADTRGMVLVAGRVTGVEPLLLAEELGVRGIITGSMPAELLQAAQSLSLTIVVTEGVGHQRMSAPVFDLLLQAQEREASLFVHDPVERGSRPEIIIPLPTGGVAEPPPPPPARIAIGQQVRLLRDPYASQLGKVVTVYAQPQVNELGAQWPGVDVQLAGGEVVYVPGANLDLLI